MEQVIPALRGQVDVPLKTVANEEGPILFLLLLLLAHLFFALAHFTKRHADLPLYAKCIIRLMRQEKQRATSTTEQETQTGPINVKGDAECASNLKQGYEKEDIDLADVPSLDDDLNVLRSEDALDEHPPIENGWLCYEEISQCAVEDFAYERATFEPEDDCDVPSHCNSLTEKTDITFDDENEVFYIESFEDDYLDERETESDDNSPSEKNPDYKASAFAVSETGPEATVDTYCQRKAISDSGPENFLNSIEYSDFGKENNTGRYLDEHEQTDHLSSFMSDAICDVRMDSPESCQSKPPHKEQDRTTSLEENDSDFECHENDRPSKEDANMKSQIATHEAEIRRNLSHFFRNYLRRRLRRWRDVGQLTAPARNGRVERVVPLEETGVESSCNQAASDTDKRQSTHVTYTARESLHQGNVNGNNQSERICSLDNFFTDVKSLTTDGDEPRSYNYEWIRYCSFKSYPDESPMFPLVLARNGWYYSGHHDTVTCFECQSTHSNWRHGDKATDHHTDSCRFSRGISSNIPIHGEAATPFLDTSSPSIVEECQTSVTEINRSIVAQTSSAGIEEMFSSLPNLETPSTQEQENSSIRQPTEETTGLQYALSNPAERTESSMNPSTEKFENVQRSQDQTGQQSAECRPGMNHEHRHNQESRAEARWRERPVNNTLGPRYPSYSSVNVRTSSFQGWPPGKTQTPKELALAGFFYGGYDDYVRCYSCGIGLKNWERGDYPWVEHARWRPTCHYVIQNRGQRFVDYVLKKVEEQNSQATNAVEEARNNANAALAREMQTPAIRGLKDMGYSDERITSALVTVKRQLGPGKHRITVQDLLDVILQQPEEVSSNQQFLENNMASQRSPPPRINHEKAKEDKSSTSEVSNEARPTENSSLLREQEELNEQLICKICMDEKVALTFIPCGHLACCKSCGLRLSRCPICRMRIREKCPTYLS